MHAAESDGGRGAALDAVARSRAAQSVDRVLSDPDWTEYVRHNLRMTKADAEIGEQVRAA